MERFGRREGKLVLVDLSRPAGADAGRRSERLVFRERFRRFLQRQFPEWNLAELSAEANLAASLSPAFPRAFLKHGQHGWAAIACPPEGDAAAALTFGLIWLTHLRAREKRVTVAGLAVYVPAGRERAVASRLACLDPSAARFELFPYTAEDYVTEADPRDYGNLETRLEPWRRPALPASWEDLAGLPGVERVPKHDGRESWRVRGVEFAELSAPGIVRHPGAAAGRIASCRRDRAPGGRTGKPAPGARRGRDREHPLYRQAPKPGWNRRCGGRSRRWTRRSCGIPIDGQTLVFAGGERGVIDLLAVDRSGRLAVVELKAHLHLPLQALDYWVHVKWHLDRREFTPAGYFPGIELRNEPPRLILASPSSSSFIPPPSRSWPISRLSSRWSESAWR